MYVVHLHLRLVLHVDIELIELLQMQVAVVLFLEVKKLFSAILVVRKATVTVKRERTCQIQLCESQDDVFSRRAHKK